MAKILWLNWSGGGNLPPSLGIARALAAGGHLVAFAGRPEMVPRVEAAGFRAIELRRAYEQVASYPLKFIPKAASFLSSPATAEEIRALVAEERPDLVIIDAMFPAALTEAAHFRCPTVVMSHTAVHRLMEPWRKQLGLIVGLRTEAGFPSLPADLDTLWMSHDLVLVSTLKSLDDAPSELGHADKIRHVGPVLESERHAARVALPWRADDPTPIALVSFSTAPEQGSPAKFQNAIDALAALPVHGIVTVGDSVDPATLKPAENVLVFATADHEDLMRRAALVVTHGGHGTFMRALKHGLPMVVIPGMAHDQAPNAAAAQAWGVGRALSGDVSAEMIRHAVQEVLADAGFRRKSQAISRELARVDGAVNAAAEIESLLAEHRFRARLRHSNGRVCSSGLKADRATEPNVAKL
ncbi:MAG: glycosyltransferase [Xanthobacteraceae bacterium]